jgi:TfoX/Sxy family transcriptional regulator of competence genes
MHDDISRGIFQDALLAGGVREGRIVLRAVEKLTEVFEDVPATSWCNIKYFVTFELLPLFNPELTKFVQN